MLHIVIMGWLFVISMLAISCGSVLLAILILLFLGVAPLALIAWIMGSKARKRRHAQAATQADTE